MRVFYLCDYAIFLYKRIIRMFMNYKWVQRSMWAAAQQLMR